MNLTACNRRYQSDSLDQKLHAGNFSNIESIGEHAPYERGAELGERNRTHERRGDERRLADVGDIRINVQVEAGDADTGDAERDDEEPEGWKVQRLRSAPYCF